jgi:hypothetical protein
MSTFGLKRRPITPKPAAQLEMYLRDVASGSVWMDPALRLTHGHP